MRKDIVQKGKQLVATGYTKAGVFTALALASVASHAEFTPPTEATTAVADISDGITWAIGIGWTLATLSIVGTIVLGLFKKFAKKGAN